MPWLLLIWLKDLVVKHIYPDRPSPSKEKTHDKS